MPAPHHSVFYRPDALPATPTNSVKALKARVYKGQSNQCSRQVQLYPVFVEKLEFDVEHLAQLIKLELVLLECLLSLHTTLLRLRVNPECIVLHSVTDIPQQVIIIIMTIIIFKLPREYIYRESKNDNNNNIIIINVFPTPFHGSYRNTMATE